MPLSGYFLAVDFELLIALTTDPLCMAIGLSLKGILVLPVSNLFNDTTVCNRAGFKRRDFRICWEAQSVFAGVFGI